MPPPARPCRDRGPFVKGRIIDLTPHTAAELRFRSHGVVPVEVALVVAEPVNKPAGNQKGQVEPIESDVLAGPMEPGVIDLLICSRQSARIYQLLSLCR